MIWPIVSIVLVVAIVALHLWWQRRFTSAREHSRRELARCDEAAREVHRQFLARQTALFDNMSEGLLLLNAEGRVELVNKACASLFGLDQDAHGRTLMETFRMHELAEAVNSLAPGQAATSFELRLSHPSDLWLQVNAGAVFDPDGTRQATFLVFHNLTRLKQLERTRQEFVANVSHELRTPLSLIKGYAETLLNGAKDDPTVATRFLQAIDRNAERLTRLVEDLLTLSELESGRLKLNPQSVDLKSAVEKVFADFKDRASARHISLSHNAPSLALSADPDRLDQVLCNLVDNAIKYGREGGTVSVEARRLDSDSFAEIVVRDDGPGIAPDALERVFERFYRVDKARSREHGGTGLGLAIVKHIVQSHGGKVWALSQRGTGSVFFITMPLAG